MVNSNCTKKTGGIFTMEDKIREEIALLRYSIIAPLISETNFEGESLNGFFLRMSEKKYKRHDGTFVTVSASTIQRWYYFDQII